MDEREQALQLGATLAGLRRSLGLTQIELAKRAGVAPSTYLRHERGRKAPSERLLERYIRELGFTVAEFRELHQALQRARQRHETGPNWWRHPKPEPPGADRIEELARQSLEQMTQLQTNIYHLLFERRRS